MQSQLETSPARAPWLWHHYGCGNIGIANNDWLEAEIAIGTLEGNINFSIGTTYTPPLARYLGRPDRLSAFETNFADRCRQLILTKPGPLGHCAARADEYRHHTYANIPHSFSSLSLLVCLAHESG
jgi:hypothetical protein